MTSNERNSLSSRLLIDPDAIASHLETLDYANLCTACRNAVIPVAADTVTALVEAIRLWDALCLTRLESANRLAAMRAALRADADGEPDPLAYLRDEVSDEETATTSGGWRQ